MTETDPLAGKRVRLRPVRQADYLWLYELATSSPTSVRWRYRGATPSPEGFLGALWDGVLAQFVVESSVGSAPLGLAVLYGHSVRGGHAYLAVLATPETIGTGRVLEGAALLIAYAFRTWNLNKLYLEVLEFNLSQFGSLSDFGFVEEGRLRDHDWHDGQWWDHITFALYRDRWSEVWERYRHGIAAR